MSETKTAEKTKPKSGLRDDFENKANQLQKKKQTRGPQELQRRAGNQAQEEEEDDDEEGEEEDDYEEPQMPARHGKHRMVPVHQSRIADRPFKPNNSTMSIKIELDLEVEVEIYARVKVTICSLSHY
jgi:hypothetical protein